MACQLERSGERVALLALLDAFPSGWKSGLSPQARVMESLRHGARRTQTHLRAIFGAGGWKHLRERLSLFRAAWTEKATATACRAGLSRERKDARLVNREAQRHYLPSPYGGAAILFHSTTPRPGIYPLAAGAWRPLVEGGFEIVDVATGFGNTLTEPGVVVVAMELTKRLPIPASNDRV
jgi:thioesterase domain-containing protein